MVRRLEPNLLFCDVSLCSGLFTPCYWRNSGVTSDSESNSFANLSRISDEDIEEEDQEDVESLKSKLT